MRAQSANGGEIMKSGITAIFSVILLCGVALAQQTNPTTPDTQTPRSDEQPNQTTQTGTTNAPGGQAAHPMKIAPGSVIPVQLAKTIDAKKAKTGDEVVATVTQDMKTNSGDVLVPKDTKVIGHVTEAQARNKEQKQSELGIAFDHAVVKGDQLQLPMSIQAIIAPQNNNSDRAEPGPGPAQAPSSPAGSMGGGQAGSAGGATQQQSGSQNYPQGGGDGSQPQETARPPITANTRGVIGMSDVKLETASQASPQGTVLSSEKNNVKIEKGTMMLLRVDQQQH